MKLSRRAVETVNSRLWHQLALGLHPACAIAACRDGEIVMDLYGGTADPATGAKVGDDTLYRVWSCGKPLAAACLWLLKDRGQLDWSDRVADHWPEYGTQGKEATTIEHVLTHRAGVPGTPEGLTLEESHDPATVVAALAASRPEYKPGTAIQYHAATFGWLVLELVNRISGQPFTDFFREEVAGPLGMEETWFGLPPEHHHRVAKLKTMPGFEDPSPADIGNRPDSYPLVSPGGLCISTARDLARFYSILVSGGEIAGKQWLRRETISDVTSTHAEGTDIGSERPAKFGLGVQLASDSFGEKAGPDTFGHSGIGTSISWGDPSVNAGAAIITTGMQPREVNTERLSTLSDLVREALASG
ncbi:MAG: serine hydrolase domain-containing protein [Chloroflexota bacterium]